MRYSTSTWRLYKAGAIWPCWGYFIKRLWQKGPNHFHAFFKLSIAQRHNHSTRSGSKQHSRQLLDIRKGHYLEIERRSALGLIWVYDRLPVAIVRNESVKEFQRALQILLKERLASGCADWIGFFFHAHQLIVILSNDNWFTYCTFLVKAVLHRI